MNTLVKFIFRKPGWKKPPPQFRLDIFYIGVVLKKAVLCWTHLSAQPSLSFSDKKTIAPIHCDVQWLSESALNFPATCSGKTISQQNNNTQSFTPKEDFKEVLLLMSLRANQVYRHGHWSQVSCKHPTDPIALHSFPEEASLCSMSSFPSGLFLNFNSGSSISIVLFLQFGK